MTVEIFCCYSREDESLLEKLKTHLFPLQRAGLVNVWYDRDISAGTDWEQQIKERLNNSQIILLLVSPDFMASDYCYSIEMQRAIERNERGEARVIPIILRPVYWQDAPFGRLQALPEDAKPITSWQDKDVAFLNAVGSIRNLVGELNESPLSSIEDTGTIKPIDSNITQLPSTIERNNPGTRNRAVLIISITTLLFIVLFGAIAFGGTFPAAYFRGNLSAKMMIIIILLFYLAAMVAGIYTLQPQYYSRHIHNAPMLRKEQEKIIRHEAHWLRLSEMFFALGSVALVFLIISIILE